MVSNMVSNALVKPPKTAFLTIRGGTRTHNLRLRRPTLYPIELRGQSSLIVPCGGFLSHRRRRLGANRARVCPKCVLKRPREPTLGDRGANNVGVPVSGLRVEPDRGGDVGVSSDPL